MAAGSYASMWASTADRDHVIEVVKASFAEGRLTRAELELRVGQALASRYFPELMELIADLPVGPFGQDAPASGHSRAAADEPAGHRRSGLRDCRAADRGDHRHPGHRRRADGAAPGPPDRRAGTWLRDGGRGDRLVTVPIAAVTVGLTA